jgi:hypothetical protein
LGVEIDTGTNAPGAILQRLDYEEWIDHQVNGKRVYSPVDIKHPTTGEVSTGGELKTPERNRATVQGEHR